MKWFEFGFYSKLKNNYLHQIKLLLFAKIQKNSSQAYCNILAGSCMAMGLRFAGSANNDAFETLFYYATHFISLLNKSVAELAGKSTVESCINVVVIALAMV
jgi:Proteasome/cyclosome repeat